jgi:tetratricopeptide (TPR) repeat protein
MKKSIVMLVLVLAVSGVAQSTPQQPSETSGASAGQTAAPAEQKVIKDPAEYNAYVNAVQQTDPNAKSIAVEGFLQKYPNTIMKPESLELLMATYQQLGNVPKLLDAATRLLQVDPNNIRALALLSYVKRQQAQQGGPTAAQDLTEAQQYAVRGLQALEKAPKPAGMSDADFQKYKSESATIFNGAAGVGALQNKNYADAQKYLSEAVKANPNNLSDVYPLALAYLQAPTPDQVQGLWYVARAINLSAGNAAAQQQIGKFGRGQYVKYHGNDEGWQQVIQTAAASPVPPAGFTIAPRPTPAQEAAALVQSKKVADMSFDEFQLIFASGNQQAIDTVWGQIKEKPIAFAAEVVEATPTKLTLAATAEDISKKIGDVTLNMVTAIPAKLMPKVGTMAKVQGDPVSFTAQPFMITMSNGTLIGAPEAPALAKKPSAARRPGAKKH